MSDDSPPAPPPERVDTDLHCTACQYNLRTIPLGGDCPECGQPVATTVRQLEERQLGRLTLHHLPRNSKVLYYLGGLVMPVACFTLATLLAGAGLNGESLFASWQSGDLPDRVGVFIGGLPSVPFYPLILWAMAAVIAVVHRPMRYGHRGWVCGGVAVGVVVSVGFATLLALWFAGQGEPTMTAIVLGIYAWSVGGPLAILLRRYESARRGEPMSPRLHRLWLAVVIATVVAAGLGVLGMGLGLLITIPLGGPQWMLFVHVSIALRMLNTTQSPGSRRGVRPHAHRVVVGLADGADSPRPGGRRCRWRSCGTRTCPLTRRSCYLATAAARGHRRVTRASPVLLRRRDDGAHLPATPHAQGLRAHPHHRDAPHAPPAAPPLRPPRPAADRPGAKPVSRGCGLSSRCSPCSGSSTGVMPRLVPRWAELVGTLYLPSD